jgi:hypothetical protein
MTPPHATMPPQRFAYADAVLSPMFIFAID